MLLWTCCTWTSLPKGPLCKGTVDREAVTFTRGKRVELIRIEQLKEVWSVLLAEDTKTTWRPRRTRTKINTFEWSPGYSTGIGKWVKRTNPASGLSPWRLYFRVSIPLRKGERALLCPTWVNIRIKCTIIKSTLIFLIQGRLSVYRNLMTHTLS